MKNKILHLFNIRQEEAWLVNNLFWLQFFQGAGVAIFNTVAFALFLQHFAVHELPKVYLFSALLLFITGFAYSKVEHALSINKLVPLVIVFIGLSIFAFYALYQNSENVWFLFLMFSWYYVIYLLSNLEFWGLAALQFDIRQSKRLFGMIGAGDIPAKLIGYSAVPALIKIFSSSGMLVVAGGSILISLIFFFRLQRSGILTVHVAHTHQHHRAHKVTVSWQEMLKGFFGNRMIALVAFLSFIIVTCVTIISFSFYSEIKHQMKTDVQLASFIAAFYAGGRILAIFIRLILTGRLTNVLGTRGSLLISPIILFVFLFAIIALPLFTENHSALLYLFGMMMIITEVLKTSLQDPVFLSLMQPLSSSLRLKGHTIVKGVMDPFALAFSGFMLYSLIKLSGGVDLYLLSYLLFTLLIVWVIMIFVVDRQYVQTLVTALDKRYSIGQEMDMNSEQTLAVLKSKISDCKQGEAIYILNLIEKQYAEDKEEIVLKALEHPMTEVRMEAIKLAERKKVYAALPYIEKIIAAGTETGLLPEAVKAKCMLLPDESENLDVYVKDADQRLMKSAIIGLMTSGGIGAVVTAGQRLLQLISSVDSKERKMGAEIIGELGVDSFYKPLLTLLKDEDVAVQKAAIIACGSVRNARTVPPLLDLFLQKKHEGIILDALRHIGNIALPQLESTLTGTSLSRQQKTKLILLLGKIGTAEVSEILDKLVWKLPSFQIDIFHALHLCAFKTNPHNREGHIALMNQYTTSAIAIIFMIQELEKNSTAQLLIDALYLELQEIRNALLLLFSFTYNREMMMKARSAFQFNKKESIANAFEVIEIEVPKEIAQKFIRIYEPASIAEKCSGLSEYFKQPLSYPGIIDTILSNKKHPFHRWTKATALHSTLYYRSPEKQNWLNAVKDDSDILLLEVAQKIKSELN